MFKTEFSSNPNGKLFMEHFNDVRLHDTDRYAMGHTHEIWLRKHFMGTARIMALVAFDYSKIRDVLAFTNFGRPSYYMAAMLKQFYGEDLMDKTFVHLVWHWEKRNMHVQEALIQDWWRGVQEVHTYEQAVQQTLGI